MVELIFDKNEDWEKRTLCSDESCIGTIGADGKCKECGKPYEGQLSAGFDSVSAPTTQVQGQKPAEPVSGIVTDDEWEKRVLCSDESCIGTIGPDGRCRECGKSL